MNTRGVVASVVVVLGVAAFGVWLAVATDYEEDRQVGYLDGIRCEAVGRVYATVHKDKFWEMRGEATSDASQVIDRISVDSKLVINGSPSASASDHREDDDHAETHIVQTWTNAWYEVSYQSTHNFAHYRHGWKKLVLSTNPCYASKSGRP